MSPGLWPLLEVPASLARGPCVYFQSSTWHLLSSLTSASIVPALPLTLTLCSPSHKDPCHDTGPTWIIQHDSPPQEPSLCCILKVPLLREVTGSQARAPGQGHLRGLLYDPCASVLAERGHCSGAGRLVSCRGALTGTDTSRTRQVRRRCHWQKD